jgi:hypothetical protein
MILLPISEHVGILSLCTFTQRRLAHSSVYPPLNVPLRAGTVNKATQHIETEPAQQHRVGPSPYRLRTKSSKNCRWFGIGLPG